MSHRVQIAGHWANPNLAATPLCDCGNHEKLASGAAQSADPDISGAIPRNTIRLARSSEAWRARTLIPIEDLVARRIRSRRAHVRCGDPAGRVRPVVGQETSRNREMDAFRRILHP